MNFRKATNADIAEITGIYERVIDREETVKVTTGWKRGIYPTEETVREALAADDLYVIEIDRKIVAAGRVNRVQCDEYEGAAWSEDVPDDKVTVLHTLAVDPLCAGKGCGTAFVGFYEDIAQKNGSEYLRIDTNVINLPARHLYAKLGFKEIGVVPCDFNGLPGIQLVLLEKKIAK